ncbi:hypothetical protein TrRE_jg11975, partial [Triparma retinervis]
MEYPLQLQTDLLCTLIEEEGFNKEFKKWFSRGWIQAIAFHHEEAIRCFTISLSHLPPNPTSPSNLSNLLLLHYLLSTCHGPNYNFHASNSYYEHSTSPTAAFPSSSSHHKWCTSGLALWGGAGEEMRGEKARVLHGLLQAESVRAVAPGFEDLDHCKTHFAPLAAEMYRKVHSAFPTNPDVAYFTVAALMQLRPWDLFTYPGNSPKDPSLVSEISSILAAGLSSDPSHLGLCHLHVHFSEMSPSPSSSLPSCQVLRTQVDASHLLHMSTHIDVLLGDYDSASSYNRLAVEADKKMLESGLETSGRNTFYLGYVCHDYHMMAYAAMLGGFEKQAMWAARGITSDVLDDSTLRSNPHLLLGCEAYRPILVHVLCRFGRWEEVLRMPKGKREDEDTFCVTEATVRMGRGLALAAGRRCGEARAELGEMTRIMEKVKSHGRYLHNNSAHGMLLVEREKLLGEILWHEGSLEKAFSVLRGAVAMDDGLNYDEPWGVMTPVRHALGGLLLKSASSPCGCGAGGGGGER